MDAAGKVMNSVSFTFGDVFEGCPHLVLQANRRSVAGDDKIAAHQAGAWPG